MSAPVNATPPPPGAARTSLGNSRSAAAMIPTLNPPTMKTAVYAPQVEIYISDDMGGQSYDVSRDIVRGQVVRKENSASSLFFTLANPQLRYTADSKFHRMDRVTCWLTRTSKIQVFSGYLDTIPWAQAYPGTVDFRATCTLKRLLHTWWNPSLPHSLQFFDAIGPNNATAGDGQIADNGIGSLVRTLLEQVGNWTQQSVHVEAIPTQFITFLNNYYVDTGMQQYWLAKANEFNSLILGDNLAGGPMGAVGYQPGDPLGTAASPASAASGTQFYLSQIVQACDARGMGPVVDATANTQTVAQSADTLETAPVGDPGNTPLATAVHQAGQQLAQYSSNWSTQNQASDAAILAYACATVESQLRMLANNADPPTLTFYNEGLSTAGTASGLFGQSNDGRWGTPAQRMNAYSSAGMFLDKLNALTGWRNMDPGQAIWQVQQSDSARIATYDGAVQQATKIVQAYRKATQGGAAAAAGIAGAIPGAGALSNITAGGTGALGGLAGNVAGAGTTSPASTAGAAAATGPVPDSEGAINAAMSYLGTPYQYGGNTPGQGLDCLVEGTRVTTSRGEIPIERLTNDDWVLTRQGYRRVVMAWKVRDNAPTCILEVDGHVLQGTPDHRIWTENRGWIPLGEITSADTLLLWKPQSKANLRELSSWGSPITDTPIPHDHTIGHTSKTLAGNASRTGLADGGNRCTRRSGSTTTVVPSPTATRSTTLTTTRSTTTPQISNALSCRNTAGRVRHTENCTPTSVRSAGSLSWHTLRQPVLGGSVVKSTSASTITVRTGPRSSVYDVMVEGEHEFFANGVLLHNCSGLVKAAFQSIGFDLPRTSEGMMQGPIPQVPLASAQRGDIIVSNGGGHVGISLGNGTWIQTGGPTGTPGSIQPIPRDAVWAGRVCANGGPNPAAPWTPINGVTNTGGGSGGTGIPPGTGTGGVGGGTGGGGDNEPIARNLFSYMMWNNAYSSAAASFFTGEKSYIEDQPLMQSIKALCTASMRSFQSAPNGDFIAYFPDWFGMNGKPAILAVEDIELTDLHIDLSDDPLTTHVYIEGDNSMVGVPDQVSGWLATCGVATMENQALWMMLQQAAIGDADTGMSATQFLSRFGVRPYKDTYAIAGNAGLEFLLACQIFMGKWAAQYETDIGITFMPELFPGMRILLVGHPLAVYCSSVTHEFDYERGFRTRASISAPTNPNAAKTILSSTSGQNTLNTNFAGAGNRFSGGIIPGGPLDALPGTGNLTTGTVFPGVGG